jgi:hypothetical protein
VANIQIMNSFPRQSAQIFQSHTRYPASLVKSWMLRARIETEVIFQQYPSGQGGTYLVFCESHALDRARGIMERINLWDLPIDSMSQLHLISDYEDDDLITTMIEEVSTNPTVSIRAHQELERRGIAPTEEEIDLFLEEFVQSIHYEDMPLLASLKHYLVAFLLPPLGFIMAAKILYATRRDRTGKKRWRYNLTARSFGWFTFCVAWASAGLILGFIAVAYSR